MPKLKFFLFVIPIIVALFVAEHMLRPSGKSFAVQTKPQTVMADSSMIEAVPEKRDSLYHESVPVIENTDATEKFTWKMLSDIKYREEQTDEFPEGILYPIITTKLKAKKGHRITITGYIIPIDEKMYALSKNVMSACFFCGMAGPETIMGIKFKGKTPRLKTDQYLTLTGTFNYNETNPNDWIYHIENAEITAGQ